MIKSKMPSPGKGKSIATPSMFRFEFDEKANDGFNISVTLRQPELVKKRLRFTVQFG
jgi:hypothetical protein